MTEETDSQECACDLELLDDDVLHRAGRILDAAGLGATRCDPTGSRWSPGPAGMTLLPVARAEVLATPGILGVRMERRSLLIVRRNNEECTQRVQAILDRLDPGGTLRVLF